MEFTLNEENREWIRKFDERRNAITREMLKSMPSLEVVSSQPQEYTMRIPALKQLLLECGVPESRLTRPFMQWMVRMSEPYMLETPWYLDFYQNAVCTDPFDDPKTIRVVFPSMISVAEVCRRVQRASCTEKTIRHFMQRIPLDLQTNEEQTFLPWISMNLGTERAEEMQNLMDSARFRVISDWKQQRIYFKER